MTGPPATGGHGHPPENHGIICGPRQETPLNNPGRWHPLARTREEDLEILATGGETGWWDDTGQPAPWPQDLLDPEAGWTTADPNKPGQSSTEHDPHNPPF